MLRVLLQCTGLTPGSSPMRAPVLQPQPAAAFALAAATQVRGKPLCTAAHVVAAAPQKGCPSWLHLTSAGLCCAPLQSQPAAAFAFTAAAQVQCCCAVLCCAVLCCAVLMEPSWVPITAPCGP